MKILWFFVLVHTVFGQAGFGTSYLKNSKLCHQWNCLNVKLGLPDALPPKEMYTAVLKSLLPQPEWQATADTAIAICYGERSRRYTNTCPGQALMHCVMDMMIQNCPEQSWRKVDACAPLTSLAGFKYMFSQSRYENLEKNLPTERRPAWFLKNYFNSKCCDVPELFNQSLLNECGFSSIVKYHSHPANSSNSTLNNTKPFMSDADKVKVVELSVNNEEGMPQIFDPKPVEVQPEEDNEDQVVDPLDCCDLSGFIEPSFRSECDFHVSWSTKRRLTINESLVFTTTAAPTTVSPVKARDVKLMPKSCAEENCVFRKLNIVSESGAVNLDAFSKLLDNMTAAHPSWIKAKARVVTKCLTKTIVEYNDECEINRILACTFDVLTENCPFAQEHDPCKHTNAVQKNITCQISSSKYRPKNRRQFCGLPNLVSDYEALRQCGVSSVVRMEHVSQPVASLPKGHWWLRAKNACQSSTESTKCLLKKIDVLNKYRFLDYFRMKDKIRTFASKEPAWATLIDVYLSAFTSLPMYADQCSTSRKFLNVIDVMLMTCPVSKRKNTMQCKRILNEMANAEPEKKPKEKLENIRRQFQLVYYPMAWNTHAKTALGGPVKNPITGEKPQTFQRPVTHRNPTYNFGILSSKDVPPVEIIDVKPRVTQRPVMLLPVYLRMNGQGKSSFSFSPVRDGILRGGLPALPDPKDK